MILNEQLRALKAQYNVCGCCGSCDSISSGL